MLSFYHLYIQYAFSVISQPGSDFINLIQRNNNDTTFIAAQGAELKVLARRWTLEDLSWTMRQGSFGYFRIKDDIRQI